MSQTHSQSSLQVIEAEYVQRRKPNLNNLDADVPESTDNAAAARRGMPVLLTRRDVT